MNHRYELNSVDSVQRFMGTDLSVLNYANCSCTLTILAK